MVALCHSISISRCQSVVNDLLTHLVTTFFSLDILKVNFTFIYLFLVQVLFYINKLYVQFMFDANTVNYKVEFVAYKL